MASIRQQILEQLETGQKTIGELYASVKGKRASVDKAVQRLLKQGIIERIDRGIYQKKAGLGIEKDFSGLTDEAKSNHELNHIGDTIDLTCELVDRLYSDDTHDWNEKLEIVENLLKSTVHFVGLARETYLELWKRADAELRAEGVDIDRADASMSESRLKRLSEYPLKRLVGELIQYHFDNPTSP